MSKRKKIILGLTGKKQSGKSTVGEYLVETYDFTEVSFADPLRYLMQVFCVLPSNFDYVRDKEKDILILKDYDNTQISAFFYRACLQMRLKPSYAMTQSFIAFLRQNFLGFFSARSFLQKIGTEWGRNTIDKDIWLNITIDNLPKGTNLVFTDVRFDSEAEAIQDIGGIIIKIKRTNFKHQKDEHESEQGISIEEEYLLSADSVYELYGKVDNLLDNIMGLNVNDDL